MTDEDLLSILKQEEEASTSYYSSEMKASQAEALDRFMGKKLPGDDEAAANGLSTVQAHGERDAINWLMPALTRAFASTDDLFTVDDDNKDDDDESLKTAAQYLRHLYFRQCGGEHITHDFIFDGITQRYGVIRTAWEHPRPEPPRVIENLSAEQFLKYATDADYELLELEVSPGDQDEAPTAGISALQPPLGIAGPPSPMPGTMPMAQPPMGPEPAGLMNVPPDQGPAGIMNEPQMPAGLMPQPMSAADQLGWPPNAVAAIKVRKNPRVGSPLVEIIPPENFRISERAKSLEEAGYHGGLFEVYLADLISEYPEFRDDLERAQNSSEYQFTNDIASLSRHDTLSTFAAADDKFRKQVILNIEYLRCDYDGDGIVELRRIQRVGDVILTNEIAQESEFTVWSPIRVSHRAVGLSIIDTLRTPSQIETELTRRWMDGLAHSLAPRTFYNDRAGANDPTFIDRMSDRGVGDMIGVAGNPRDMIQQEVVPDISASALQALTHYRQKAEEASGINGQNMGFRPQQQHDTSSGIDKLQSAGLARVEQYARFIATGLEAALGKLLRLVAQNNPTKQIFKVSGKRVEFDPRLISDEMTVAVHVGMTAESRERKLMYLGMVAGKQEAIMMQAGPGNPLVSPKEYRNTLAQMTDVMGYRNSTMFFKEIPEGWQPPEPGPDPKMLEAQAKQAEAQAKLAADQAAAQAKLQLTQQEMAARLQMSQADAAAKNQMSQQEMQAKMQMAEVQFEINARIEQAKNDAASAQQAQKMEFDRQLAEMKLNNERIIAEIRIAAEAEASAKARAAEMELAAWKQIQDVKLKKLAITEAAKVKRSSNGKKPKGKAPPAVNGSPGDIGNVQFGGKIG